MSGPVETELPPLAFRRRDKLRLSLSRSISDPDDLKSRVRSIDADELVRRLQAPNNKHRQSFLLLDCRGYLCYADSHIRGAVHIACTDRFNRKRVQNSGSVLDLVSTNNRRNKTNGSNAKWREVIVYDEGTSDLDLDLGFQQSPISFVLLHLLQEGRHPVYLKGGMKEFCRFNRDLCDSCSNKKDLSMTASSPTTPHFQHPLLPPLSPPVAATPNCVDTYENEPPTRVLPFLYVGNARDSADRELLRKLGIRYILSVTTTPFVDQSTEDNTEFRTKLIPASDNLCENLAQYFDDAYDFIEEARKSGSSILIHCQAGISRSPTLAIAYIMKHINMSTLDAYAFVQRSRRIISPNLNFMGQLVEFESKLKGNSSQSESSSSFTESCSSSNVSSTTSSGEFATSMDVVTPMILGD